VWERFVLVCRGTRGRGEVREGVGVEQVAVRRVDGDYIVCRSKGIESLREWIQLGRIARGGGGGADGRAVDGDGLALSGLGVRPAPVGCRALEEGRDEKRLERLPPLAHDALGRQVGRQSGRGQRRGLQRINLRKTTEMLRNSRDVKGRI
jgi:hypothetical protein